MSWFAWRNPFFATFYYWLPSGAMRYCNPYSQGRNTVDANNLHGFIPPLSTQVADGALHVGHELEHLVVRL